MEVFRVPLTEYYFLRMCAAYGSRVLNDTAVSLPDRRTRQRDVLHIID